jgi:hypothetical protein
VDRILTTDGVASGVRLVKHGAVVSAGVVISTVGLHITVDKLLRQPDPSNPNPNPNPNSNSEDGCEDPMSEEARDALMDKLGGLEHTLGHFYCFVGFNQAGHELGLCGARPEPDFSLEDVIELHAFAPLEALPCV